MTEKERGATPQKSSGPDWIERLATIISAVLVLGVIAVLVWDAVHPDRPASLDVSTGRPTAVGRHWHVPIVVRNSGDVAVQEVNVSVSLQHPDTTVRDIDIRIDWLPGRSERAIDAVFAVDPSRGKLTAEVQSFDEP
jgi:uncharacterized protein (TIGR02588 family)